MDGRREAAPIQEKTFAELGVSAPLIRALEERGIDTPFPIQSRVLPVAMSGGDVLAMSPTGSGKTLAFLLPIVEDLEPDDAGPTALILAPTRELATQIHEEAVPLAAAAGLTTAVVLGGSSIDRQVRMARDAHILVATPGRLIDLLKRGSIDLENLRTLVLDEADRMLDMGFKPQTDRIVGAAPRDRQTMLFSATLQGEVNEIARSYTNDPARLDSGPIHEDAGTIAHRFESVSSSAKLDTLVEILAEDDRGLALVFSRTRHGTKRLRRRLEARGVPAAALHGDLTQAGRERALRSFAKGDVDVLVATDVAARGIDLPGITHVIHFDAPTSREDFVHRSGRTGRAGRDGICITLVTSAEEADVSRLAAVCGLEEEYRAAGLEVAPPRVVHTSKRGRRSGLPAVRRPRTAAAPAGRANRVPRRSAAQTA